jgi:hypothetical protein
MDQKLGLLDLDVMATVGSDDQLSIARHRRDGRMIASVFFFESLPIGTAFVGCPAGQNDQRYFPERVFGLGPVRPQTREFLGLERVYGGGRIDPITRSM